MGQLGRSPHSPRPFVFHFLCFYYSSSVLEGGSGEPFVSYLTVIHNLPRNHHDIINHPYGQLPKSFFSPPFIPLFCFDDNQCVARIRFMVNNQHPNGLFNKSNFCLGVHSTSRIARSFKGILPAILQGLPTKVSILRGNKHFLVLCIHL